MTALWAWPAAGAIAGALAALLLPLILRSAGASAEDQRSVPRAFWVELPLFGCCVGAWLMDVGAEPTAIAVTLLSCLLANMLIQIDARWFYLPDVLTIPLTMIAVATSPEPMRTAGLVGLWAIAVVAATLWQRARSIYLFSASDLALLPLPLVWFGFTPAGLAVYPAMAITALAFRSLSYRHAMEQFGLDRDAARGLVPFGAALLAPAVVLQLLAVRNPAFW